MKRAIFLLVLILGIAAYVVFAYTPITLYFSKTPIDGSNEYFKNPFGKVFIDSTSGCFDICLLSTYSRVAGADSKTFKVLKSANFATKFAKDKNNVYWDGQIIDGADPQTFKTATYSKGFDSNNSYSTNITLAQYINEQKLGKFPDDANLTIVSSMGNLGNVIFEYDNKLYYLNDSANTLFLQEMQIADVKTFMPALDAQGRVKFSYQISSLEADFLPGYDGDQPQLAGKDTNLYYVETYGGIIMAGTSTTGKTYKYYGGGYSYFEGKIYYRTNQIVGADPVTFTHLGLDKQVPLRFGTYAKDAHRVYFGTQVIEGADPATFAPVNSYRYKYGEFAYDKNNKYKSGKIINDPPQNDIDKRNLELYNKAYEDYLNPQQ